MRILSYQQNSKRGCNKQGERYKRKYKNPSLHSSSLVAKSSAVSSKGLSHPGTIPLYDD